MVSLYLAENLASALKEKLTDFFTKKEYPETITPLPIGILVPNSACINGLKVQLSRLGSLIHVYFFTPNSLREFLSNSFSGVKIASEKDIDLATALTGLSKEETLFWSPLLQIATKAGFSNALTAKQGIADRLKNRNQNLLDAQLRHPIEHDRAVWQHTIQKLQENHYPEPRFHHLFIAGFGYESTHLFPLFLQALTQSTDASVFLDATQDLEIQELWVHTWEKFVNQEARWIPNNTHTVSQQAIQTVSFQETLNQLYKIIKDYESLYSSGRIAITSFCNKTLREVAAFLQTFLIPCSVTLPIQNADLPLLQSWCRYQEEETIGATLHFAQVLLNYKKIDLEEFTRLTYQLQKIAHTLQSNNLSRIRNALSNHECLSFFEDWPILPPTENLAYWDEKITEVLEVFDKSFTENPFASWLNRSDSVTKSIILEYINHSYKTTSENPHPWGRIWIGPIDAIPFVDAVATICLCAEPSRAPRNPYNHWTSSHNQEITISLNQNSLEKFLHVPFGYILNEDEESLSRKRHLNNLIKSDTPIIFLGDLTLLPEEILEKLEYLEPYSIQSLDFENSLPPEDKLALQKAHLARRTPNAPFGPYEFTYTPKEPLCLSSSAWEEAFNYPALAFYKHVLHLQPPQLSMMQSGSREKGIWVHQWLQENFDDIESISLSFYNKYISENKATDSLNHNILYQSLWEEAQAHALQIRAAFESQFSGLYRYSEIELPKNISLELSTDPQKSLKMRGRIDALLTQTTINNIEDVHQPICIIDFKTSSRKPLTKNNLQKGYALQLLLYGLALRKIGATQVTLALVSPEGTTPLTIDNWSDFDPILEELLMISKGHFGDMAPNFENSVYSLHPTATLPIDPKILFTKYRSAS